MYRRAVVIRELGEGLIVGQFYIPGGLDLGDKSEWEHLAYLLS